MNNDSSWMRQNMSKSGGSGPSTMHPKISGNNISSFHSKIARPSVPNYADGGEVDAKSVGLESSASEDVGFFKRMAMGNIDEKGSEAYNRFGAGRGEAMLSRGSDKSGVSEAAPAPAPKVTPAPVASTSDGMDERDARDAERAALPQKAAAPAPAPIKKVAAAPVAASKKSAPASSEPDMSAYVPRRTPSVVLKSEAKTSAPASAASSDTTFDPDKINFGDKKVASKTEARKVRVPGRGFVDAK